MVHSTLPSEFATVLMVGMGLNAPMKLVQTNVTTMDTVKTICATVFRDTKVLDVKLLTARLHAISVESVTLEHASATKASREILVKQQLAKTIVHSMGSARKVFASAMKGIRVMTVPSKIVRATASNHWAMVFVSKESVHALVPGQGLPVLLPSVQTSALAMVLVTLLLENAHVKMDTLVSTVHKQHAPLTAANMVGVLGANASVMMDMLVQHALLPASSIVVVLGSVPWRVILTSASARRAKLESSARPKLAQWIAAATAHVTAKLTDVCAILAGWELIVPCPNAMVVKWEKKDFVATTAIVRMEESANVLKVGREKNAM